MSTPTTNLTPEALARIEDHRRRRFPSKKSSESDGKVVVSVSELNSDSERLAELVSGKVDCIIGVAHSGITAAAVIATMLHIPLLVLRETEGDIISASPDHRISTFRAPLVVHDSLRLGQSLAAVKKVAAENNITPKYAVVYYDKRSEESVDYFVKEITGNLVLSADTEPNRTTPVKRMDWTLEYPCVYRGEQQAEGSCGCAGVDKVPVYACQEKPGTQCVVLKSNQGRMSRKDRKWSELRACEDCPFAKCEIPPHTSDPPVV